ncbi:MAG: hypothetical protein AAGJ79_04665 [Verrucomicrobiota bacterium]
MTPSSSRPEIRTPLWLKASAATALAIPVMMMVNNSEEERDRLASEVTIWKSKASKLTARADKLVEEKTELLARMSGLRTEKLDMAAALAGYNRREMMLERTVDELRGELAVAREEAKILVANFEQTSGQLQALISRTDEQAYIVLQQNSKLKTTAREREAQMLDLLAEVSSLNTEVALLKEERAEMNKELGKLTAALSTLNTREEPRRRLSLR